MARKSSRIFVGLGVALVLIALSALTVRWYNAFIDAQAVKEQVQLAENSSQSKQSVGMAPLKITAPHGIDAPIQPQIYDADKWTVSANSIAHLFSSADPKEPGNIILYGHNSKKLFKNIPKLQLGEKITLTLADGSARTYTITERARVQADNTSFLQPTKSETLTLYTCIGFLDRERFILRAVPSSP